MLKFFQFFKKLKKNIILEFNNNYWVLLVSNMAIDCYLYLTNRQIKLVEYNQHMWSQILQL